MTFSVIVESHEVSVTSNSRKIESDFSSRTFLNGCEVRTRDGMGNRGPTFGEIVPRLGISATFGEKIGELRYLGIF